MSSLSLSRLMYNVHTWVGATEVVYGVLRAGYYERQQVCCGAHPLQGYRLLRGAAPGGRAAAHY
eukprot:11924466-Prorocentrum_lima.AAC.1